MLNTLINNRTLTEFNSEVCENEFEHLEEICKYLQKTPNNINVSESESNPQITEITSNSKIVHIPNEKLIEPIYFIKYKNTKIVAIDHFGGITSIFF